MATCRLGYYPQENNCWYIPTNGSSTKLEFQKQPVWLKILILIHLIDQRHARPMKWNSKQQFGEMLTLLSTKVTKMIFTLGGTCLGQWMATRATRAISMPIIQKSEPLVCVCVCVCACVYVTMRVCVYVLRTLRTKLESWGRRGWRWKVGPGGNLISEPIASISMQYLNLSKAGSR